VEGNRAQGFTLRQGDMVIEAPRVQ
jgi:hypothetical protein